MIKNPTFTDFEELNDNPQVHRNFLCPEYNGCLTDAAFLDLDLHCFDCPLKERKDNTTTTELEIAG